MTQHAGTTELTFRTEVVQAQTTLWLGSIRLAQPLSSYLIVACALMVASALVLFVTFASISKKIPAPGVLSLAHAADGGAPALTAELYVTAKNVGRLSPGMPVTLRFVALPYPRYGQLHGVLGRIGRVPDASRSASEALYPATVMLEQPFVTGAGRTHALEPGMVFEATILQERRVLWRWIFEPLAAYFDQP